MLLNFALVPSPPPQDGAKRLKTLKRHRAMTWNGLAKNHKQENPQLRSGVRSNKWQ